MTIESCGIKDNDFLIVDIITTNKLNNNNNNFQSLS